MTIFSEDSRVKIPCILHLRRLGYQYLSIKEKIWDKDTNIFPDLFRVSISKIKDSTNKLSIIDFCKDMTFSIQKITKTLIMTTIINVAILTMTEIAK